MMQSGDQAVNQFIQLLILYLATGSSGGLVLFAIYKIATQLSHRNRTYSRNLEPKHKNHWRD